MAETKPLLTIAIPTWNRAGCLSELLDCLGQQQIDPAEVEILVSDNASPDNTPAVVQQFIESNRLSLTYHRQLENVGPDANFISCYHAARGRYFWVCSDDDIILPGAVERLLGYLRSSEFDLIHITSYGFRHDWKAERQADPLNRIAHTFTDAAALTRVVNISFTFVSGMVINKERLETIPHEDPSGFNGTYLVQLSWTLPFLLQHRCSLVIWERLVAGRQGNAIGGYSLGRVFGENLVTMVKRCLPGRPDLAAIILNFTVRRWLPSILYTMRRDNNRTMALNEAADALRHAYGSNLRYWVFAWPVLHLPLPLAGVWARIGSVINKLLYVLTVPNFWRKQL